MSHHLPTLPCISNSQDIDLADLLKHYFTKGFTYLEIKEFLSMYHKTHISLSTIKRHLKSLGLFRRPLVGRRLEFQELYPVVEEQLQGSASNVGYRRIWSHLSRNGVLARREDIRKAVKDIDPEGVSMRKRRKLRRRKYRTLGPNYVWHIDGHDKLKPYGFSLHGCIDGYSRRILWLEVSSSNKRPELIARYYLDAAYKLGGIPRYVKADDGTEHSIIEPIHVFLRNHVGDTDFLNAFSIVSSPCNQRIEAFWSKLRQDRIGWWKIFFQDLVDLEIYSPSDPVFVDCARFCFINLLRKELRELTEEWNQHIISKSTNGGPSGRPDTMFFLSHLYGSLNHLASIENDVLDDFLPAVDYLPKDYSEEFEEFATSIMNEYNLVEPESIFDACQLFIFLSEKISEFN